MGEQLPKNSGEQAAGTAVTRYFQKVVGSVILAVILLLPYRLRVAASDWIGLFLNGCYKTYIRLLRWFFSKLN